MLFSWRYVWPHRVWVPFFLEPILSLKLCLTRKSMSSFILFWSSYCFLALILFLAQCLTRKSMSSFFVGTLFGTLFGPKSYEFLFLELFFFENPFFWHNVWPEKVRVFFWTFFCGVHTFLAHCWPEKVWVPFFPNPLFFEPILFWRYVFEFLFFWSPYFF